MDQEDQQLTPFFSKLKQYCETKPVCFDVPGHKLGHLETELNTLDPMVYQLDANAPLGLDILSSPSGVLKQASDLAAKAFHAEQAFFITGGTSLGNLSMFLACLAANDKVILPRNVHKSIINAILLSGAVPLFIKPQIDKQLGIANQITLAEINKCCSKHADVKAIFINNPTYFGIVSDLKSIVEFAHSKGIIVLVDEAHGCHFAFNENVPLSAMDCGADASSMSIHKTGGSLTQSSLVLCQGSLVDPYKIRAAINMLHSTSPNSVLLASLDVARKNLYFNGKAQIQASIELAEYCIAEINKIDGLFAPNKQYFKDQGLFDNDVTKVIIQITKLDLTGIETLKVLRNDYNIQMELSEPNILLAVFTIGTSKEDVNRLITALKAIAIKYYHPENNYKPMTSYNYIYPKVAMRPRSAFHSPYKFVSLEDSLNEVVAEAVMIYPPGIPLILYGEIMSQDIINELEYHLSADTVILKQKEGRLIKIIDKAKKKTRGENNNGKEL
jgi:lysine decarboxylase